jgi:hypothetical protein
MDFKSLVDIYFHKKKDWSMITDKDKESLFFIFNRYMSKKYPKQEPLRRCPDITLLKKEFNYKPMVNLNKGLNLFNIYAKKSF